jgi:undecaprenyl-diphosphatase
MSDSLHLDPPFTPRGLLLRHPALIWIVVGLSLLLAGAAAFDQGSLLLIWDEPIQEWIESHRTSRLETVFRSFSRLGSNIVIFAAFAVIVAVTARRCRALALALTVAVLARPAFEFVVKGVIGRDRPDFDRLVDGTGFSHPSGHVLAAVTLWGLLPPLVALVTGRRWVWWIAVATSATLIIGISASRMYLGVHWFSDIVQGLLLGWLYLALIETLYLHHHRTRGCLPASTVDEEPSLCDSAHSRL